MSTQKRHRHAELILQYAQDAMETDKPWERWEYRREGGTEWFQLFDDFAFVAGLEYRRKPRTININGFEVPEPMSEKPEIGSTYYMPMCEVEVEGSVWEDSVHEQRWLSWGICHSTREAAELHAKALLSFTKK